MAEEDERTSQWKIASGLEMDVKFGNKNLLNPIHR